MTSTFSNSVDPAIRFDEAWQSAVKGGKPPVVEDYLKEVDESDRANLAVVLHRIERTYRVRISFGSANTIAIPDQNRAEEVRAGDTFLIAPVTAIEAQKSRLEPPIEPSPESLRSLNYELSLSDVSSIQPPERPETSHRTFVFESPSGRFEQAQDDSNPVPSPEIPISEWIMGSEQDPKPSKPKSVGRSFPTIRGYELVGELGRGGMGVVYKAIQQGLNRPVAIKVVLGGEHARPEDLARFKTEAEAVASIQHSNIVQIYEVGDRDGLPFFSLEYVDGGTLQQKIDGKPQRPREAAEIVHQLAEAMRCVHERGVIHRDLKPANVLMTLNGTPKITDFGLAKRIEGNSSQTRTGSLMGTPSYMAPEQARGDTSQIGPLSDLYSLGAVLYELLTGRPPFQGATLLETMDQVRSQEPVPPTRLQPKIPRDLETICLKCLQKVPIQRYPSLLELTGDLRRFLDGEPIKARPVGRLESAWRWAKRNPRIAALSGSILSLLLILLGVGSFAWVRHSRELVTINEARRHEVSRIHEARAAIESGDARRALAILGTTDSFLETTPALQDVRDQLRELRTQVRTFQEFRDLLDHALYEGFFGLEAKSIRSHDYLRELLALQDEIETRVKRGKHGLPPLSKHQLELFNESRFEAFLMAASMEVDRQKEARAKEEASRRALVLLDRAEKLLPPSHVLYVHRQGYREILKDSQGAESDKKQGESIQPNSPVDHFWHGIGEQQRGEKEAKRGQSAEARKHLINAKSEYAKLIQVRPDHFWGYMQWSSCNVTLGQYYDAIIGYTECVKLRPDAAFPYHNRAVAHAKLGEFEEAVVDENVSLKRDSGYIEAYFGRGIVHQALGKYSSAIADFDEALVLTTSRSDVYYQRAAVYFQMKNYQKALDDYNKVIELAPGWANPWRDRASTQIMLKNFEAALSDYRQLNSLMPVYAEGRYMIGVLQLGLGRSDDALTALGDCLRLDPGHPRAYLARAQIHWRRGDAEAALADINRVVSQFGEAKWDAATKADYLNDRADLFRNQGKLEESENDYRISIALNPKQIDAYIGYGLIERKRGKLAEAEAWYDKMLATDPDSGDVHARRAEFFRDLGRWDDALAESNKVTSLDAKQGPGRANLLRASIQAARGEFDRAVDLAERTLKADSGDDDHRLYEAACVWSLASRSAKAKGDHQKSKQFADKASDYLKKALTIGFHSFNYQEQGRMGEDPALEPIMGRPEVRKLLLARPQ